MSTIPYMMFLCKVNFSILLCVTITTMTCRHDSELTEISSLWYSISPGLFYTADLLFQSICLDKKRTYQCMMISKKELTQAITFPFKTLIITFLFETVQQCLAYLGMSSCILMVLKCQIGSQSKDSVELQIQVHSNFQTFQMSVSLNIMDIIMLQPKCQSNATFISAILL